MSLAKTAIRLLLVETLKDATLAGKRVFDSRIDDFNPVMFAGDALPTLIVLTDKDEGDALSDQNGGSPFRPQVDITIEMGMVQAIKSDTDPSGYLVGYPDTDARLEASLDLIEYQIKRRLSYDPAALPTAFRQTLGARIWRYECHRQVLEDSDMKAAVRLLTLTIEVPDDEEWVYNINPSGDDATNGVYTTPTGIDVLPDPLRSIIPLLPSSGYAMDIINALAAAIAPLEAPNKLDGVDIDAQPADLTSSDPPLASAIDVTVDLQAQLDAVVSYATTATVVLDYKYGRAAFQKLVLQHNVTSISVINWDPVGKTSRLILVVENAGGFVIDTHAWPTGTIWPNNGGDVPVLSTGAGEQDIVVLATNAAGAPIYGNLIGQDYGPVP